MSLNINGIDFDRVVVNNTDMTEVVANGITVWTSMSKPPYYDELKSGTTLTEAQWLAFLNGDGIKYIITKGETSTFLGKKVSLTNSVESTYTTWSIGDFNHDSTNDTVDLILDNNIHAMAFNYSTTTYSNSRIRSWVTDTYYNGFSTDTKSKLQTMAVASHGSTLNDKVKLLSFTEVNGSTGTSSTSYETEGTRYPIFSDNASRVLHGARNMWWLRSHDPSNTFDVWHTNYDGSLLLYDCTATHGLIPVIRF